MKVSSRLFYGIAVYLGASTIIYFFATTMVKDDGNLPGGEWIGITCLVLSTVFALMLAAYFHFTERRQDILPQDWEEAEVEDGTGTYGFFSASSIWPAAMSGAIFFLGAGIIYMNYTVIGLGAVLLIWTGTMLNLQYGIPKEKH